MNIIEVVTILQIKEIEYLLYIRDEEKLDDLDLKYCFENLFSNINNTYEVLVAIKYYAMKGDLSKLVSYLHLAKQFDKDEFEDIQLRHYQGILYAMNNEYQLAKDSLEETFKYLESHRVKIYINGFNYGLDYKAIVMCDLATIYLEIGQYSKAKKLYERANIIFYYKTNNKNRSYIAQFGLATAEIRDHNMWQAKVYLRNIERAKYKNLEKIVLLNLSFVYYMLNDLKNSKIRIDKIYKFYEKLSDLQRGYFLLTNMLVESANGNMERVNIIFVELEKIKENISDEKFLYVYDLQRAISLNDNSKNTILDIKNRVIPYFIEKGLAQYTVQSMKFIELQNVELF